MIHNKMLYGIQVPDNYHHDDVLHPPRVEVEEINKIINDFNKPNERLKRCLSVLNTMQTLIVIMKDEVTIALKDSEG